MASSILTSVKKLLGIAESYEVFDADIVMHINSVFSALTQMGIGPDEGFSIEDATPTWSEFLGDDPRFNAVKSYVVTRVKLLFDPPTTSFLLQAYKDICQEFEWRMNVVREGDSWVEPTPTPDPYCETI